MSGSKWKWDMQYLASQKSYIDEKFEGVNASKLLKTIYQKLLSQ